MKIRVWNENCLLAGQLAYEEDDDSGDVTVYEGTSDEILNEANSLREAAKSARGGQSLYLIHLADTLENAANLELEM